MKNKSSTVRHIEFKFKINNTLFIVKSSLYCNFCTHVFLYTCIFVHMYLYILFTKVLFGLVSQKYIFNLQFLSTQGSFLFTFKCVVCYFHIIFQNSTCIFSALPIVFVLNSHTHCSIYIFSELILKCHVYLYIWILWSCII